MFLLVEIIGNPHSKGMDTRRAKLCDHFSNLLQRMISNLLQRTYNICTTLAILVVANIFFYIVAFYSPFIEMSSDLVRKILILM